MHLDINLLGKRQVYHRCECEQQNEGRNKTDDKQEKAGLQELREVEVAPALIISNANIQISLWWRLLREVEIHHVS